MRRAEAALLLDLRGPVRDALRRALAEEQVSVRQSWPKEPKDGVVVTYGEYSNVGTDIDVVDSVTVQVDVWAFDRETAAVLSSKINRAMLELGLKRVYSAPDEGGVTVAGYEHRGYRFGRRIDKRTMRMIG